jgi:fibronectin-binding autotransporter adhesin
MRMAETRFGWTAALAVTILAGACGAAAYAVDYNVTLTAGANWTTAGWAPSSYPGQVVPPGPYDTATIVFNTPNSASNLTLDTTPIYLQKLSFTIGGNDKQWGFAGSNTAYLNTFEWNACTTNKDGTVSWTVNNLNSTGTAATGDVLSIRNMVGGSHVLTFSGVVNAWNGLRLDGKDNSSYLRFTNLTIAAGGLEIGQARVEMTGAKTINGDLKFSVVGLNTTGTVYSDASNTSVTGNMVLARGTSSTNNISLLGGGTITVTGDLMVDNGVSGAWLDVQTPVVVAKLNETAGAAGSALNITGNSTLTSGGSALRTGATNISGGTLNLNAANGLSSNNSAIAISGLGRVNAKVANSLGTAPVTLTGGSTLGLYVSGLIGSSAANLTWTGGRVALAADGVWDQSYDLAAGKGLLVDAVQTGWKTASNTTGQLQAKIGAGAMLTGDLTNATYGTVAAGDSIELASGALVQATANAPPTTYTGGATMILPLNSNTLTSSVGAGTIYAKAQVDTALYTPATGSYTGVLSEGTAGQGFTLEVKSDKDFNGAKFNTTAAGLVTVTGSAKMTFAASGVTNQTTGSTLTVLRQGTSATGNSALLYVGGWQVNNGIKDGQTWKIQDGILQIDDNGNNLTARHVVSTNATVEALSGGTVQWSSSSNDPGAGAGGVIIRDGGALAVASNNTLDNLRELTIASGASAYYIQTENSILKLSGAKLPAYITGAKGIVGSRVFNVSGGNLAIGNGNYLASPAYNNCEVTYQNNGTETNKIVDAVNGTSIGFVPFGNYSGGLNVSMDVDATGSDIFCGGDNLTTISARGSMNRVVSSTLATDSVTFKNPVTARNLNVNRGIAYTTKALTLSGDATVTASATLNASVMPGITGSYYLTGGASTARTMLRGTAFAVAATTTTVARPIHVGDAAQARFYQENIASGTTVLNNVTFDGSNAVLQLDRGGSALGILTVANVTANGSDNYIYLNNADPTKSFFGNFSSTSTGSVYVVYQDNNYPKFNGQINAGVTVHYGGPGYSGIAYYNAADATFQMSGGTFVMDQGTNCGSVTLLDTSLVHTGKMVANAGRAGGTFPNDTFRDGRQRLQIAYGESGKTWGDSNLTFQITNSNPLNFYANDNAAGTSAPSIVNEVNAIVQVAAGDKGYLNAYPGSVKDPAAVNTDRTYKYGTVKLNHVQLGDGASLSVSAEDNGRTGQGTHLEMSFDLAGAGTVSSVYSKGLYGRASRYIKDVNNAGTLKIQGSDAVGLIGTVSSGAKLVLEQYSGSGDVTCTPANTFILNGTLEINKDGATTVSALDAANFAAGGFSLGNGASLGGSSKITGANVNLTGNNTLYSSGTFTIDTGLTGGKTLSVSGAGNQIAAGSIVNVNNGTINADSELAVNGTFGGAGSLTVNGTLKGVGTVNKPVAGSIGPHVIAPGNAASPVGTLNLANTLTLNDFSTLDFDISGATADLLAVAGQLGIVPVFSNTPTIALHTSGTLSGNYTLATYATSTGIDNSKFTLPTVSGYTWDISETYIKLLSTGSAASVWNKAAGGSWNLADNWTGGVPNAAGAVARLGIATTGSVTVDSGNVIVGTIEFTTANAYTVHGPNSVTMQASTGALIDLQQSGTTHTLDAPLIVASNTEIKGPGSLVAGNISSNSGTTLSVNTNVAANAISGSGSTTVNGSLTADSIVQNTLSIGAGGVVTIRETTGGNVSSVPEPGTWVLIGTALLGWLALRRRRV